MEDGLVGNHIQMILPRIAKFSQVVCFTIKSSTIYKLSNLDILLWSWRSFYSINLPYMITHLPCCLRTPNFHWLCVIITSSEFSNLDLFCVLCCCFWKTSLSSFNLVTLTFFVDFGSHLVTVLWIRLCRMTEGHLYTSQYFCYCLNLNLEYF